MLERANIIHIVRHSSGQGLPIGSETDFETFKVFYLDVGLCQAILGSDISTWFLHPLEGFENRGEVAESFIGQELVCYADPHSKAEVHFWKRNERSSSAEIDYLIQRGEAILPIEVKSGHGSTLRSLRLFLDTHPKISTAIRFSSLNYSVLDKLDSRPLYAAASLAHRSQEQAIRWLVSSP